MASHFTLYSASRSLHLSRILRMLRILVLFSIIGAESYGAGRTWKNPTSSPTGSAGFKSRAEVSKSRWTLKDWLEQKERNKMMDLWLGMYSPSPYEFILSAAQIDYRSDNDNPVSTVNQKSWVGSVHFYAMILGIGAQYENNWNEQFTDLQGSINVRLAGNSNESTHFNIFGGLRNRVDSTVELLGQPFAGAELQIYIQSQWGLHGNYRSFFSKTIDGSGTYKGDRTEGGIFIEFSPIRIFGNWYSESSNFVNTVNFPTNKNRTGWMYGLRLIF